jgi:hypothetical protein
MYEGASWEAGSPSATQKIKHFARNPKYHYRVHKSPLLDLIWRRMNPVHDLPNYFFKIHFLHYPTIYMYIFQNIYSSSGVSIRIL